MNPIKRPPDLPASNHYPTTHIAQLGLEYRWCYENLVIRPSFQGQVDLFVAKVEKRMPDYLSVWHEISVPWYVTAANDMRENSCNPLACLANGQPWGRKTTAVPVGAGPWNSWVEAAVWAYNHEGYGNLHDWTLETCFWRLEMFNGSGYRACGIKDFTCRAQYRGGKLRPGTFNGTYHGSMQDTTPRNAPPYIYNGSQFYLEGISIEDHSFYSQAIDDQLGCMALLKGLEKKGHVIFTQ